MKRFAALAIFTAALLAAPAHARIIHVSAASARPNPNGASWPTAYRSLTTALDAARSGDEVRVRAGTYYGNFTVPAGVRLLGGFLGRLDLRHPSRFPSTL